MTDSSFDFYDDLIIDAAAGTDPLEGEMPSARVLRRRHKLRMAKMLKQETLADAIHDPPAPGESIHAVSNGTYDFATWIPQMLTWIDTAHSLWVSTWTLSRPNADDIFALHDEGKIAPGQLHFLTGLYFKRREAATYNYLLDGLLKRGGRYKAFENHCKVLLMNNPARDAYIVVESSANLNANPRFEQYVITNDRTLFDFHKDWMEEVFTSIIKTYRSTTTARETAEFRGYSIRRAGLGVTVYSKNHHDKTHLIRAKLNPPFDSDYIAKWATYLASLIATWLPAPPPGTIVTTPPQGASWPGPYFAHALAAAVAAHLKLPYHAGAVTRTDTKQYHHPMVALRQTDFLYTGPDTRAVIIIDDLITSGATMKRAIKAAQTKGIPAYGFACYGA
jgi:hypothetical protein